MAKFIRLQKKRIPHKEYFMLSRTVHCLPNKTTNLFISHFEPPKIIEIHLQSYIIGLGRFSRSIDALAQSTHKAAGILLVLI